MSAHPPATDTLLQAAARVRALAGRPVVVKLGGSAMEDPVATHGALESVAALQALGVRVAVVHGGGKPIDRAMATAGLQPRKVAGRRYTDDATLEVVVRVLKELNAGTVALFTEVGGRAGMVTNADATGIDIIQAFQDPPRFPLVGDRLTLPGADGQPVDLGRVGKPTRVDAALLGRSLALGYAPVLPSLARSAGDDGWLNVNADTAASAVAGALRADACLFLTDTPGVLRDIKDPGSLLSKLTRAECDALIRDGVIGGGMVPKVEACFEALEEGATSALILDGRVPYSLLDVFLRDTFTGTEITK
jgi:acetylglutamate kinase